jgi:hypothetical protein
MGDRRAGERHVEEVLAGLLGALLDGEGHLLGLAVAEADAPGAVADHDEGGEAEATTALHDLGDAVDVDHPRLAQGGVAGGAGVDELPLPVATTTAVAAIAAAAGGRAALVLDVGHQNSSPASRAASASAATRPW